MVAEDIVRSTERDWPNEFVEQIFIVDAIADETISDGCGSREVFQTVEQGHRRATFGNAGDSA